MYQHVLPSPDIATFLKTSAPGSHATPGLRSGGMHHSQICIHISHTDEQVCLKFCFFWTEEMMQGLGMWFFSRWLSQGQVCHMVWDQMGSIGTHVPSNMQTCSCRHADISNAYMCPMLICRYGCIYLDSTMAIMAWHVPVDPMWCPSWPRAGSRGTPFLKVFKWNNSIFYFVM